MLNKLISILFDTSLLYVVQGEAELVRSISCRCYEEPTRGDVLRTVLCSERLEHEARDARWDVPHRGAVGKHDWNVSCAASFEDLAIAADPAPPADPASVHQPAPHVTGMKYSADQRLWRA